MREYRKCDVIFIPKKTELTMVLSAEVAEMEKAGQLPSTVGKDGAKPRVYAVKVITVPIHEHYVIFTNYLQTSLCKIRSSPSRH